MNCVCFFIPFWLLTFCYLVLLKLIDNDYGQTNQPNQFPYLFFKLGD